MREHMNVTRIQEANWIMIRKCGGFMFSPCMHTGGFLLTSFRSSYESSSHNLPEVMSLNRLVEDQCKSVEVSLTRSPLAVSF